MNGFEGLVVIAAVLAASALGAVLLADLTLRTVRPADAVRGAAGRILRRSAVRALVALVVVAVVLVAIVAIVVGPLGGFDPASGYALPLVVVSAGLLACAAVPGARTVRAGVSTASLSPRGVRAVVSHPLLVLGWTLAAVSAVLPLAAAVAAPLVAPYRGAGVAVATGLVALLVAAAWAALRRIALQPAALGEDGATDSPVRAAGARLVLLLAAGALLGFDACIALHAGVWLWTVGPLLGTVGAAAIGAGLTVLGGLAALAVLPAAIAAVAATAGLIRMAARA